MASLFQGFDALSGGTTHGPRRRAPGGFEAPTTTTTTTRKSLDVAQRSFETITDLSTKSASSRKPDSGIVPFGDEFCNRAALASDGRWKRDVARERTTEQSEKRTRAPNVLERLMGLDTMPDEGIHPVRNSSQGAVVPSSQTRNARTVPEGSPVAPEEEKQRKVKEELEAKQQLEDMNRQLEEKKRKVRATLDKARIALSQGIIAEPRKGLGKFEESKEFLEAMEFLQCNEDFIFQFLQQKPHVVFSNDATPGTTTTTTTHPKPTATSKKGKGAGREGFSPRAIARLFMPSDYHRKRNNNDHSKQQSGSTEPHLVLSEDVKRSSSTNSRYMLPASPKVRIKPPSRDEMVPSRNGARDFIVEIKERLRRRELQQSSAAPPAREEVVRSAKYEHNLRDSKAMAREIAKTAREEAGDVTLTKSLSTGKRVSMMRPDMDDNTTCTSMDGEGVSTPATTTPLTTDPSTLRAAEETTATTTKTTTKKTKKKTTTRSASTEPSRRGSSPRSSAVEGVTTTPVRRSERTSVNRSNDSAVVSIRTTNLTRSRSVLEPASPSTQQNGETRKKLGFFSVGWNKKGGAAGHGALPEAMAPVASAIAESGVPLDSAVGIHVREGKGESNPRETTTKARRNNLDNEVNDGQDSTNRDNTNGTPCDEESLSPRPVANDLQDQQCSNLDGGSSERVRVGDNKEAENVATPQLNNHCDPTAEVSQHQSLIPTYTSTKLVRLLPSPPGPASGPESDFAFVRALLVTSGFHTHGGRNRTRWHSAMQPLGHHLLEKLQATGCSGSHQRILFDAVNEVLITKLEASSTIVPAQCYGFKGTASPRRFVEDVWNEIHERRWIPKHCQDHYLESLVAQDLRSWPSSLHRDVERLCLQLEKGIWSDLMEELIGSIHS